MIQVLKDCNVILNFLSAPVKFLGVPDDMANDDIPNAVYEEYKKHGIELERIPSLETCELLNEEYFETWTKKYMKHFQEARYLKSKNTPVIELFAAMNTEEASEYRKCLSTYYDEVIDHAEMHAQGISPTSDEPEDLIRLSMPAKLKALKYGVMKKRYGSRVMKHYPVLNKFLLNALSEQLKGVKKVITEVSDDANSGGEMELTSGCFDQIVNWVEPLALLGATQKPPVYKDHLRAVEHFLLNKTSAVDMRKVGTHDPSTSCAMSLSHLP